MALGGKQTRLGGELPAQPSNGVQDRRQHLPPDDGGVKPTLPPPKPSDARRSVTAATTEPWVEEQEATEDTGERFDPFCHTLDGSGRALCFADIRGRHVHTRELPTTGTSATVLTCQRCRKVVCPTCQEIEAGLSREVAA